MNDLNIHWFRNDLRLHDNPALQHTIQLSSSSSTTEEGDGDDFSARGGEGILPIFIFDNTRTFGSNVKPNNYLDSSSRKCGPRRAQFILEAVADLRYNLERCGSGLIVAVGKPELVLGKIAAEASVAAGVNVAVNVVCQEEVCSEELSANNAVCSELGNAAARKNGIKFCSFITTSGSTLYDVNTLPQLFDGCIPDTFTPFRKEVEKSCKIGVPLDVPSCDQLKLPSYVAHKMVLKGIGCYCSLDSMPTLTDLGYNARDIESISLVDPRCALPKGYCGGETFALSRVQEYIWDLDLLRTYFDTRNGMVGTNYSTKFAPWLTCGCLSPRYIAGECARYEEVRVKNKSTYWVVFELLVRDYFKLFAKKHGDVIFYPSGTTGKTRKWDINPTFFQAWKVGMTGFPLVDASMRELNATGFMSNRGRQNVCSFLAIDLNIDWRLGAEYFEETLIDYDVTSNWINWAKGAGVTGGCLNRFNIVKQSKTYDQNGEYVRLWCPELQNVPDEFLHEPWQMSETVMIKCGVALGSDYPRPIVDPTIQPKRYCSTF